MAKRAEWAPLFDAVRKAGWRARPCRHGWLVWPPDKALRPIALGGTPSDCRAVRNATAALRRAGLAI